MDVPDIVSGDEAGDQAIASQSADRVLNSGVNVVIGAAASGMSLAIIDKVTGAGVAQCSGSNTAPTFTDYSDNGLYFRTAPSDALQGPILGDVIVGDGHSNVAIVARADDYGKGLADATATALEGSGATVALNESYDPKSTNFDSVVQKVSAAEPDAVVVIAFEEGTQILSGLIEAGLTADKVGLYGADGLRNTDLGSLVSPDDPSVIDGMKGTAPASADNPDFVTSLEEFAPELEQTQFAPQVFDCVTIMALAAEQAKSTTAEDFKDVVNGITKDGEKCDTFADCKKLIDEGTDIDYDGVSGPLDFTDAGEPGSATIEVYGFSDGGTFETISTETSQPAQ
jgi:branched-chain amino acid transport system substrate-binding protein